FSRDSADRRRVLVSLTPEGHELWRAMIPVAEEITQSTLAPLNPAERVALQFLLEKMISGQPGVAGLDVEDASPAANARTLSIRASGGQAVSKPTRGSP